MGRRSQKSEFRSQTGKSKRRRPEGGGQNAEGRKQNAEGGRQNGHRHPRRRIAFAQNFLTSERLVRELVRQAGIGCGDVVLDIGAGSGIITAELARVAARVIAIEKDPRLVRHLRERFRGKENVKVVECDFLRYRIRVRGYKVFANIPYNTTTAIVRKLLESPLAEAHLIMQKEPARRLTGVNLLSLLAQPCFEFEIVRHLRRTDFHPVPDVDSVVLRIRRRNVRLLDDNYREFVSYGFSQYKRNLRLAQGCVHVRAVEASST